MKNTIKFIAIAILISISILAVNAQDVSETSTAVATVTEKVEKKVEAKAKRQANSDEDSWTGFYVGGFGGYANGRASVITTNIIGPLFPNQAGLTIANNVGTQKVSSNGFNGGGTFGYNNQKGKFLAGVEVDFGGHKVDKTIKVSGRFSSKIGDGFSITQSVKSDWMLTARPRVGVVLKKTLLYGTGGLAVTKVKYAGNYLNDEEPGFIFSENGSFAKTKVGWTAGAGIEFKLSNRWSVKGEYLFSQFSKTSITSNNFKQVAPGASATYPTQITTHSTDLKSHSLRFGVNYRF